jgi:hypothetical protein
VEAAIAAADAEATEQQRRHDEELARAEAELREVENARQPSCAYALSRPKAEKNAAKQALTLPSGALTSSPVACSPARHPAFHRPLLVASRSADEGIA